MAVLEWFKDNSMKITATVGGSGSSAVVTGTLLNPVGTQLWTGTLASTGTADTYSATVHPASAAVLIGPRYRLRVVGTYGGAQLEFDEGVTVQDRRSE